MIIPLLIDFDYTLFDANQFKEAMFASFPDFEQIEVRGTYRESITNQHYHPSNHAQLLASKQGEFNELESRIQEVVRQSSNFLYPDTVPFLESIDHATYQPILFTYGNPDFQSSKVRASNLGSLFQKIIYTEGPKSEYLAKNFPLDQEFVIIDDIAQTIDETLTLFPNARGFLIDRRERFPEYSNPRVTRTLNLKAIQL